MNLFRIAGYQAYLQPNPMGRSFKLYLTRAGREGKYYNLEADSDGKMCETEQGLYIDARDVKPFAVIPEEAMQGIMDELWAHGVRPKERRHEVEIDLLREQLAIQEKHLEDMRALVFSLEGKVK